MWKRSLAVIAVSTTCMAAAAQAQAPEIDRNGDPSVLSDTLYSLAVNPDDYPDHASVYLFDDAIVRIEADGQTTRTFRRVVHILRQEAAEEWGEYGLPYYPERQHLRINWIRVLRPDGTVISDGPEHEEETTLPVSVVSPIYSSRKIKRFTLGGVTPGTIVDFSFTVETFNPTLPGSFSLDWHVNTGTPIRRSRLMLDFPSDYGVRISETNLDFEGTPKSFQDRTVRTWTTTEIPAIQGEWYAGYPNEVLMEIEVAGPLVWNEIAQFYHNLSKGQYGLTSEIRDGMAEVVQHATSLEDTLAAMHRWIAQDLRYASLSLGDGSYRPRSPAEVYETRFGDCKDKTTLFISLARDLGLVAFPVLVSTDGGVDSLMPSLGVFNHMIAAVNRGDRHDYVDLTTELVPYGEIPSNLQGELGLSLVSPTDAEIVVLPADPPGSNRFDTVVRGALSDDGSFSGSVTWTATGTEQYELRGSLYEVSEASKEDLETMARDIAKDVFEDATVDSSSFSDGRDLNSVASLTVWLSDSEIIDVVAGKYLVPIPIADYTYTSVIAELEAEEERQFPISRAAVNSPSIHSSTLELTLPKGWQAQLPDDVIVDGIFGRYEGKYNQSGRVLTVSRELGGKRGLEPPDSIGNLIRWMSEISEDRSYYLVIEPNGTVVLQPSTGGSIDPAAILLSIDDLGDYAVLEREGPVSSDATFNFSFSTPETSLEREFGSESMVFNVGESQMVTMTSSVSVYPTAAEAGKGVQILRLIDVGQMMKMMIATDPTMADQTTIEVDKELDLSAVSDMGTGWIMKMVTPFMQLDVAVSVSARGRSTVSLLAVGPAGKIHERDLIDLLEVMDERIRTHPALLADYDDWAPVDPEHDLSKAEMIVADSSEGIALDMILPRSEELPGSIMSSESFDRVDGHPYYERFFEGRGFGFSLGGSEILSLQVGVELFDNVPLALEPVADFLVEAESGMAELLNEEGEFAEFVEFMQDTEMEHLDSLEIGIYSAGIVGRIRGFMTVDMYLLSYTSGRTNVEIMALTPPDKARLEDILSFARHIQDRLFVEAPEMADLKAESDVIEAVQHIVRVQDDINQFARNGELDSALEALTLIDTATSVVPVSGTTWNSLCWYGSLWRYENEVLPACEAAVRRDSTNWAWRDSRGLALALTGDTEGAIRDFEYAVQESGSEYFNVQRNEWLQQLRQGKSPFTAQLLEELRGN